MSGDGRNEMTLLIALSALNRLGDPAEAVAAARTWSENVGVVSNLPADAVRETLDSESVDCDFISSSGGKTGSLAAIRQRFPTDRHVFVGTDETDRRTAEALGWEYLPVEEAAEKAEWSLSSETDE